MTVANGHRNLGAPVLLALAWLAACLTQRPESSFLGGCRRWSAVPAPRSITAAAAEDATAGQGNEPPATVALQLPAANYFTALAAGRCLEEGCSVAEAMDIYAKFRSDGPRLEEALDDGLQQHTEPATQRNNLQDSLLENSAVSKAFEAVFGFSDLDVKGTPLGGHGFPLAGLLVDQHP